MFKIGSGRLTWMAVKWQGLAEDGTEVQNEIQCQVDLVDRSKLGDQLKAESEGSAESLKFAQTVTKDWKGVGNQDGASLPYSPDNLALIFEAPGFAAGWGQAYLRAWQGVSGIREGNFATSPGAGPVAGEASPAKAV